MNTLALLGLTLFWNFQPCYACIDRDITFNTVDEWIVELEAEKRIIFPTTVHKFKPGSRKEG